MASQSTEQAQQQRHRFSTVSEVEGSLSESQQQTSPRANLQTSNVKSHEKEGNDAERTDCFVTVEHLVQQLAEVKVSEIPRLYNTICGKELVATVEEIVNETDTLFLKTVANVIYVGHTAPCERYRPGPEVVTPPYSQCSAILRTNSKLLKLAPQSGNSFVRIGRGALVVDLVISHPSISRLHTVFQFHRVKTDNGFETECLLFDNSKRGTKVNGARVLGKTYFPLKNGDKIHFGTHKQKYTFLMGGSAEKELIRRVKVAELPNRITQNMRYMGVRRNTMTAEQEQIRSTNRPRRNSATVVPPMHFHARTPSQQQALPAGGRRRAASTGYNNGFNPDLLSIRHSQMRFQRKQRGSFEAPANGSFMRRVTAPSPHLLPPNVMRPQTGRKRSQSTEVHL